MNPENYDPPTFEEVMREKEDTITALRAEVERLNGQAAYWEAIARKGEKREEALEAEIAARDAEVRALREKVDELLTACDDSDGAQYGTIATKFVRAVLQGESRQRGDGGKYGAALHQNLTDRAWQALRDWLNGVDKGEMDAWSSKCLNDCADAWQDGYEHGERATLKMIAEDGRP
jgi:hypothetical protein